MTKKRRYLVCASTLAACVCIVLGVLAMMPARPGVTKANFDRIEEGMTQAEVDALLGKSRRGSSTMGGGTIITFADYLGDDGARAAIVFWNDRADGDKSWTDSTETLTDKLRRWLRLPRISS
jgi:hypothetical protein